MSLSSAFLVWSFTMIDVSQDKMGSEAPVIVFACWTATCAGEHIKKVSITLLAITPVAHIWL